MRWKEIRLEKKCVWKKMYLERISLKRNGFPDSFPGKEPYYCHAYDS